MSNNNNLWAPVYTVTVMMYFSWFIYVFTLLNYGVYILLILLLSRRFYLMIIKICKKNLTLST